MRVVVITPPEPILSWDEAKAHLRLDGDEEQAYVEGLIAAAQGWINGPSGWLGRSVGVQTLELHDDHPTCPIVRLPYPPVIEVLEAESGEVAVDVTGYRVGAAAFSFGAAMTSGSPIRVQYRAGYENPPAPIKQAMLLLIGQWFSFRSNVAEDGAPAELPMAFEALLSPFRVWSV
jgi:hypothetical protein